jgi:hypothetical protein
MEFPYDGRLQKTNEPRDMSPNLEKPVPVLSKRNVERLVDIIHDTKPQLVVEFGSGASALFFC